MAAKTVPWKMQQRQGKTDEWESKNPVLAAGEFGYDTTNDIVKIGNGVKTWSALPAFTKKKYDLNAMSWSEIAAIAAAGRAPCVFNVGDEKQIKLSTGEVITVVILGFCHDGYYNEEDDEDSYYTITFGMKNCLTTRYQMNASSTNAGGWESSKMRTSVMSTLLSQLPSDLQSVIKEVYKKTSAGNKSTTITTTSDKLFLFSEVEINGTTAATYSGEGAQYAYFKRNGGYAATPDGWYPQGIKALSDGDGSAYNWWLRSPYVSYTTSFRYVATVGYVSPAPASNSYGVSFGFCV